MAKRARFAVVFSPQVVGHLDVIDAKYHGLLQETIGGQLTHSPTVQTRNRKPLDEPAPFGASWELRCGPDNRFRVFYQVDAAEHLVEILAIGVKVRNRLVIGGEEYAS